MAGYDPNEMLNSAGRGSPRCAARGHRGVAGGRNLARPPGR